MISLKLCRTILVRSLVALVIISSFLNVPAYSQESEDSQIFISGFNAYQQKDYATTITKMNEVLQKHPDSPLRDMVLFWLARAYFKNGNQLDAARYMSQFSREFPDNPLKGTVDEELLALAARYEKGEKLPGGSSTAAEQKAEQERSAALRAEAGLQAAEQARLAAAQKERERIAAVKAEQERMVALKAAEERKAVDARRVAEETERARLAAAQKELERAAAAKAEQERLASAKAAEVRKAADAAVPQKAEAEKVDMEQVAREQAEMVRQAMAKAEQKRLAVLKAEEAREAAEKAAKAEQKRIAAAKAEEERAAASVEEKRLAALKAEEDRQAAEKAERLRVERDKVEQERRAAAETEAARTVATQKEQERKAAEKAEAERQAREKSAVAKRAAEEAEQKRLAAAQAEQERIAAQRVEKERQAIASAAASQREAVKQAERPGTRDTAENRRAAKAALREKAIAQYRSIIEKYPSSKAAVTAAAKLKELGVAVSLPPAAAVEQLPENAQVLRFEVAQFAGLEFSLSAKPQPYEVSRRISVPFEVTNRGNGSDSFYLESGFPAEFGAVFAAAAQPEQAVNQTTVLAPGEAFKGLVSLVIPPSTIDGLRISYPVKAASRLMAEATQSRELTLTAAAPLLRALVKTDKNLLLPGEKALYRVTVLNVGSTVAQDVTLRLSFPPQLEPVDYAPAGFRQEVKAALVLDGMQIKSGERREFSLMFQLKDDSLAGQELLTRAELVNNQLKTAAAFVSNAAHVQKKHGVLARTASERLVVIPGQTVTVPFVVTNTGNVRETFKIASTVTGAQEATVFQDINRDGIRQANEPVISEIGPLAPREEAGVAVEIRTPRSAADGSQGSAQIVFSPDGEPARSATGLTQLLFSRPVLQMAMSAREGRLKPGEVATFDLNITNRGSSLARIVELRGTWPEQLELVAADPSSSSVAGGTILWNFKEFGAGEKRTVKVSFRVKPGTGVGTNIQVKSLLSYEDQLGNRY